MKRTLKATTALLASVNLAVPLPALAQAEAEGRDALDRAVEACVLDTGSEACQAATDEATSQGAAAEDIEAGIAAEAEGEATTSETSEAPAEADATADADTAADGGADLSAPDATDATDESAAPEAPAEPESAAPASDQPVTETTEQPAEASQETTSEPAPEAPEAEVAPDSAVDEELPSESELQEGLSEAPEASTSSATETETDAETVPESGTDTPTETAPAETSEGETAAELPSEDELRRGLSADAEAEAGADAEADVNADGEPTEGEAEATTDADGTTQADADTTTEAEATAGDATTSTDAEASADTTDAEAETGATAQTDAEAEALAGTAPVAAAAAEDAEVVDSITDTVTEEEARTSNEDFDSAISREATAQTETQARTNRTEADDDDDDGLSNLEKALLVGAGALAVGTLLNNRQVVASSNDRVVVSGQDGGYELIKDDNALLRQPGAQVQTETFDDGSTRTTISYDDGSQVVTIRDADLRVVRRVRVTPDGQRVTLIDDLNQNIRPVDVSQLRQSDRQSRTVDLNDEAALRQALAVDRNIDRAYSLSQVRNISEVRQQVPAVDLEAITFDSGSAAIRPEQAEALRELGTYIRETIADDPRAVFLVEGHTDAVGDAAYNLALSDRRAESVALALGEYFDVPTANLVVQGYGERFLKRQTQDAERANRRASVRNITPLLQVAAAN